MAGKLSDKDRVNLEWWQEAVNVGDQLSPVIHMWMCQKFGVDPRRKMDNRRISIHRTKHVMELGSILGMGEFDACVWGSGIHCEESARVVMEQRKFRKYDIRAVRGPLTGFFLRAAGYECPEVYGDPAVLMPLCYKPQNVLKKYKLAYVGHYDQTYSGDEDVSERIHFISAATADYQNFINEIVASEIVLSSSLHGIILAESYGVPAVFVTEGMEQELMKFLDWYYSTDRYEIKKADSLKDGIGMAPMKLPDLNRMQEGLINSVPVDLWKNGYEEEK